ncbi:alpha/beta fold hydrolase [Desertivirga brevis]|uniref:alpha/beta fold hydrolase n=1 Tax=Desertivirga brevis TaxID=2810310 RepID=UPI001A972EC6|nr:alpha/beta fold hydrolase [Pedobacter sp. SYSU D00873]
MLIKRALVVLILPLIVHCSALAGVNRADSVIFEGGSPGIKLGGTLSFPKQGDKFPVAVILSGTGKQDRDGTMAGHKLFLALANHLNENGYAVLRMDDRGVGKSTGVYEDATTLDFANDALAAVQFLKGRKEIDPGRMGFIGHSEGGAVMSIAASKSSDIAFMISLAGLATNGYDSNVKQNLDLIEAAAIPEYDKKRHREIIRLMFDTVLKNVNSPVLDTIMRSTFKTWSQKDQEYFKTLNVEFDHFRFPIESYIRTATGPWYRYFMQYNPEPFMKGLKMPVLAINGDKDLFVSGKENLNNWKKYLQEGGNRNVTTLLLPGVNHLLQRCKTCTPQEYSSLENIDPTILQTITNWLRENVKQPLQKDKKALVPRAYFPEEMKVPFKIRKDVIYVAANLNKKEGYFLFDSGCPVIMLNKKFVGESADAEKINGFSGINGGFGEVRLAKVDSLKWGKILLMDFQTPATQMEEDPEMSSINVFGLLGLEAFKNYEVTFDYDALEMTFRKVDKLGNYVLQPKLETKPLHQAAVTMQRHIPILTLNINNKDYRFGIDCGAAINIIYPQYYDELKTLFHAVDTLKINGSARNKLVAGFIKEASCGPVKFRELYTGFAESHLQNNGEGALKIDGLLGTPFLVNYITSINFRRGVVSFYPRRNQEKG